jgi:SSS family solute:Na+ symporter
MVQSVLGAKNIKQGQLGANFTGWLKIIDVPLFILPGIMCFILFPDLSNPDEAYMTMVTELFPTGMKGLVMAVLIAALVSTIDSALNALSTVFTMDIFVKKIQPDASQKKIVKVGHMVTVSGAILSIFITMAIDSIKGLNLFDVFQSVLGFIAPPMSVVFLFGVLWKKTTTKAANIILIFGTLLSLLIGVLYLWVFPNDPNSAVKIWPHFLLLSFYIFVFLSIMIVIISTLDKQSNPYLSTLNYTKAKLSPKVKFLWITLIVVMICLYLFFNGNY